MTEEELRRARKNSAQREYAARNREKTILATKKWRESNPDKIKAYRKEYYEEHRDIILISRKDKYHTDIEGGRERCRTSYRNHREKRLAICKKWQTENSVYLVSYRSGRYKKFRAILLAKAAIDRAENPERHREYKKRYRDNNPEHARIKNRAWHEKNREKANDASRNWRRLNPEMKRAHDHNRRARLKQASGTHTADDIVLIFKMQRGKCAYCRISIKNGYDVDHIIPLAKGGTNWARNIQLTCEPCNQTKHAADPITFARRTGRLI